MLRKMHILLPNNRKRIFFLGVCLLNITWLFLSIKNDMHFFCFNNEFNEHTRELYLIIKFIWIVSVVVIEHLIYLAYIHRKSIAHSYKNMFIINTVLYGVFFILLFPGNWGGIGDELLIYWAAKNMWIWPQQGAVSGLIMIWELMFFPATWMPVLIKVLFTDIVFTRITGKLWNSGKKVAALLWEVIMFSAVALIYTYNPMRMWLFTVVLIAFLAEFYFAYSQKSLTKWQKIYMCFLLCMIVCIRTEAKYMILWAPIILIILFKHCQNKIPWKLVITLEGAMLLSVVVVSAIFNNIGGNAYKYRSLSVVSYVCPLSEIFVSDKANLDDLSEEMEAIDAVFPLKDMIDNPSAIHFWNFKHWIDDYADASQNQIRKFQQAAFKIFSKNITIFMNTRWQMFEACMPKDTIYVAMDIEEIKTWCENNDETSVNLYKDFDFKNPMRMETASLLGGKIFKELEVRKIIYSFVIPLIFLAVSFGIACYKKRVEIILIIMTAGAEFILMYLLIPSAAYMYYVPYYMLGWGIMAGVADRIMYELKRMMFTASNTTKEENKNCK